MPIDRDHTGVFFTPPLRPLERLLEDWDRGCPFYGLFVDNGAFLVPLCDWQFEEMRLGVADDVAANLPILAWVVGP